MGTLNDATCPRCGKRFGWGGRLIDRPPCPGCSFVIPQEELEADEREMELFRKILRKRKENRDAQDNAKGKG